MLTTGNERTCAYACVSAAFISRPMAPAQDLPDVLDAFCLRTNEVLVPMTWYPRRCVHLMGSGKVNMKVFAKRESGIAKASFVIPSV
ncbi:hypothetical protein AK812_SmicGene12027 [Symbiodinium microadriaticum]|uniref:Uncharacterized protein n=1 Tax=Symbiodinium microadriaticum TaxID=2951 RepID=A0A1Q9EBM4_SYMMI|nr:hypothetical protein AK812_SmicGene12027 [Symbiodinium microadriaticum]